MKTDRRKGIGGRAHVTWGMLALRAPRLKTVVEAANVAFRFAEESIISVSLPEVLNTSRGCGARWLGAVVRRGNTGEGILEGRPKVPNLLFGWVFKCFGPLRSCDVCSVRWYILWLVFDLRCIRGGHVMKDAS